MAFELPSPADLVSVQYKGGENSGRNQLFPGATHSPLRPLKDNPGRLTAVSHITIHLLCRHKKTARD